MPEPRRVGPRIAPVLAVLAVLAAALAATVWQSLRVDGELGVGHYSWILDSQLSTVANTLVWLVVVVLGTVTVSVVLAVLLGRTRGAGLAASTLLVPAALTLTGAAVAWRLAFAFRPAERDQVGIVNEVATAAGLSPVAWLTQEPMVNTVVLATALVWVLTGLALLLLAPAVRAIPAELLDAARREGQSALTVLRRVVLPSIRGPIAVVAALSAVAAIRAHDIVRVATGGAFGTSVLGTESIDRSFVDAEPGRGAALAVVMVVLVSPAMVLGARWRARRDTAVARVTPVERHRALGRAGRHSAPPAEVEDSPGRPPSRRRRLAGVTLGVAIVVTWLVPAVGLAVAGVRPPGVESGWWHVVADPTLTLGDLRQVLADGRAGGMWSATLDSAAIAVPVVALTLLLGSLTADAIRSLSARRRSVLQAALVTAALLPLPVVLHPLSEAVRELGFDATLPAVWLGHVVVGTPLVALLLVVAQGRGAVSAPALVAVAAVHLVWVWNDYLVAVTLLGGEDATISPVTVRLAELVSTWGQRPALLAAATLVTLAVPLTVLISTRGVISGTLLTPPDPAPAQDAGGSETSTSAK